MATYSIAEAQDQLSELIDQALSGENVTITRDGREVVELLGRQSTIGRRSGRPIKVARSTEHLPPAPPKR